jgi:hypothetical protein
VFSSAAAALGALILFELAWLGLAWTAPAAADGSGGAMQKRWLFVWRDMSNPKEVERMIARFPRAQADGYNGVAFSYNVAPEKASTSSPSSWAERTTATTWKGSS